MYRPRRTVNYFQHLYYFGDGIGIICCVISNFKSITSISVPRVSWFSNGQHQLPLFPRATCDFPTISIWILSIYLSSCCHLQNSATVEHLKVRSQLSSVNLTNYIFIKCTTIYLFIYVFIYLYIFFICTIELKLWPITTNNRVYYLFLF